jgi:class 3 adenylate cyclase
MFCEVVNPTTLSEQLDPDDFHDVITVYQETSSTVVRRFSGYVARQIGGASLVYFGYPVARDDASRQAVHAGLALIAALPALNARLQNALVLQLASPLQIRIGIHTGVAVVGEMGNKDYSESMALGDTPNIAARILALAGANTLVVSAETYRLVRDRFTCVSFGTHSLKGIATPLQLYQVVASEA